MKIERMQITDLTTRDELVAYVNDLEEGVQKLETEVTDLRSEIEDVELAPVQLERLEEAADLMVKVGKIHNTPYAKAQWVDGK